MLMQTLIKKLKKKDVDIKCFMIGSLFINFTA